MADYDIDQFDGYDEVDDLRDRVDALESEISSLQEQLRLAVGLSLGLMNTIFVKVMSESDDAQQAFTEIMENAIRENINAPHKRLEGPASYIMKRIHKLVNQPTGDMLLRLFAGPPGDDQNKSKTLSGDSSKGQIGK